VLSGIDEYACDKRPAMKGMSSSLNLERVYDEHAQAVFGFVLNLLRDESDTHDVLQELFAKLARHPQLLHNVRDERGYLLRLAHNQAIDLIRRRAAREKKSEAFAAHGCTLFAATTGPDEQALAAALAEAMGDLPPEQRAVAHLKLWEKLTFEQIADTLDIPANTAASRYRYALDKLRDRLRPIYDEIQ
jgi:RNA polymerase sigma-70 factor, ECF subfamily